jgi:hypothetical protein
MEPCTKLRTVNINLPRPQTPELAGTMTFWIHLPSLMPWSTSFSVFRLLIMECIKVSISTLTPSLMRMYGPITRSSEMAEIYPIHISTQPRSKSCSPSSEQGASAKEAKLQNWRRWRYMLEIGRTDTMSSWALLTDGWECGIGSAVLTKSGLETCVGGQTRPHV